MKKKIMGTDALIKSLEKEAKIAKSAKETTDTHEDLPPFNLEAQKPDDIFPLPTLITSEEVAAMKDPYDYIYHLGQSKDTIKQRIVNCPMMILNLLSSLPADVTHELKNRCLYMKYYTHLFHFFKITRKWSRFSKRKGLDEHALPKHLVDIFCQRFAESHPNPATPNRPFYDFTLDKKIKIINHLLILALTLNNFKLYLPDIAQELNLSNRILTIHLKRVGCELLTKEVATLRTPCAFQSLIFLLLSTKFYLMLVIRSIWFLLSFL